MSRAGASNEGTGYAPRRRRGRRFALLVACAPCLALAQRAEQNAVVDAQDAFGNSTGYQTIGLYTLNDVRGFNPQQAGNLRIEGFYFDYPSNYVTPCLVSATTMRVGIAAQNYAFPAPSGIADLTLSTAAAAAGVDAVVTSGSYAQHGALLEGRGALGGGLSGSACFTWDRHFLPDAAFDATNSGGAASLRWQPDAQTDVRPFWSMIHGGMHRLLPVVYTDGLLPPPGFSARALGAQDYTRVGWQTTIYGLVARRVLSPEWTLAGGVFRGIERDQPNYIDQYLSILPDRTADHVLDVVPRIESASTSGEWRLSRVTGATDHVRALRLTVRGRDARREFGGDAIIDYGVRSIDVPLPTQVVPFSNSAVSTDQTRQLDVGFEDEERWSGRGSFGIGLLRSHYTRTLLAPGAAPTSATTTPWLPSARFTLTPRTALTFYGSYITGLEDSALAPSEAANRGEPPPATRSHQLDAGLRYAPRDALSLLLGVFEIKKPYFNLDDGPATAPPGASAAPRLYRALGEIRHRGVEASAHYSAAGLTLIAGAVLLRPRVTRVEPTSGASGSVPLGPVPALLNINLDYVVPRGAGWAGSLQLTRLSRRVATNDDATYLPALTLLDAGIRYEVRSAARTVTVRLDMTNLTNSTGLRLTSVGQVIPQFGRQLLFNLALDD
ncbi:MAG: TonB-dependent receptor [Gammaproteobacteria bacterium]|nr:TonB-dependent receptor [Gammaproteobacteria bacterium]